jgi:hypothetical protein
MSYKEGAQEAIIGIFVGFIPILVKLFANQFTNADTILAIFELSVLIGMIKKIDTVKEVPWKTAAGYFFIVFTVGRLFMPEWEAGMQLIYFIMYFISKIK